MKPSHPAESAQSPQAHYAPSVPMSVYRELAAELRADKAVIDSLNSRNQLLQQQNQRLKQEIHSVVQATLTLGQFAGVARQSSPEGFPSAIAPDTLARLVRTEASATDAALPEETGLSLLDSLQSETITAQTAPPAPARQRVPRPISPQSSLQAAPYPAIAPAPQPAKRQRSDQPAKKSAGRQGSRRTESVLGIGALAQNASKLFTEKSGEYRSSALDSPENKEISSIWLVLSIILIIVTAFGAGFLIMKPLLNDR
ncbi:hypothetical protein [Leptolyngbya sp. BC1307]|uniref:hypothetical protein n=1 Tax=Leptolyngbya sp. BC1307 TaxID=2029589 RepID=UPI001140CD66|nr:hypothetical protein [Leptolyngbya sp. BC1307]